MVACTLHCTSRSCTQKNVFISQMLRFEICKTHGRGEDEEDEEEEKEEGEGEGEGDSRVP